MKIHNIVFLKYFDEVLGKKVSKAHIFYENGEVKETSSDTGALEMYKLLKDNPLHDEEILSKIHYLKEEEFKERYNEFLPNKKEISEKSFQDVLIDLLPEEDNNSDKEIYITPSIEFNYENDIDTRVVPIEENSEFQKSLISMLPYDDTYDNEEIDDEIEQLNKVFNNKKTNNKVENSFGNDISESLKVLLEEAEENVDDTVFDTPYHLKRKKKKNNIIKKLLLNRYWDYKSNKMQKEKDDDSSFNYGISEDDVDTGIKITDDFETKQKKIKKMYKKK